jgi:hypothetical protein
MWGRKHAEGEINPFGKVRLIGCGDMDFGKALQSHANLPAVLNGKVTGSEQAVNTCLALTGGLMQLEIATRKSLIDGYGGGYEVATIIDGKCGKIGDITYLFWRLGAPAPYKAIRYAYEKDILLMRSQSTGPSKEFVDISEHRLHVVSPVYRDVDMAEIRAIPLPSMNAQYLCVYFLLPAPRGVKVATAIQCAELTSSEKWVIFGETPGRVGVDFRVHRGFYQWAARLLQPHLSQS